jgi:hypothetical protein
MLQTFRQDCGDCFVERGARTNFFGLTAVNGYYEARKYSTMLGFADRFQFELCIKCDFLGPFDGVSVCTGFELNLYLVKRLRLISGQKCTAIDCNFNCAAPCIHLDRLAVEICCITLNQRSASRCFFDKFLNLEIEICQIKTFRSGWNFNFAPEED